MQYKRTEDQEDLRLLERFQVMPHGLQRFITDSSRDHCGSIFVAQNRFPGKFENRTPDWSGDFLKRIRERSGHVLGCSVRPNS